jgi:hypothetical protein
MYLSKEQSFSSCKREALQYQPSFDLRKNIAKVVAHYSMAAVQKGITLDIFVAHETPNYFYGNVSCFLVMLSQLLKHCIDSLDAGEISIRIYHESLHQSNSSETELSIITTTHNSTKLNNFAGDNCLPRLSGPADRKIQLNCYASLEHINHFCNYFDGNFSMQKLEDREIQYIVTFILQQAHPARILHLV